MSIKNNAPAPKVEIAKVTALSTKTTPATDGESDNELNLSVTNQPNGRPTEEQAVSSEEDELDGDDSPPDFSMVEEDEEDNVERLHPEKKTATASEMLSNDSLDLDEDNLAGATVEVAKPECLTCGCLVSFIKEPKKLPTCHFSKQGEDTCPARSVKIVLYVNVKKIVDAFLRAERTGDHARSAKLYAQLATKSEWEQKRITDGLNEARRK